MSNKFPSDESDDFTTLRRDVDELKALLKTGQALTTASAGWVLPNRSHPANPADGVHIYGNGDDLAILLPNGTVKRIPGLGSSVANPAAQTAVPLPGGASVTGAQYNLLGADMDAVWQVLVLLLAQARGRIISS